MFNNIGEKIKKLAKIVCCCGVIVSILLGAIPIVSGITNEETKSIVYGFVIISVGTLVSWVSVFVLYGFGQMVENSDKAVRLLDGEKEEKETEEDAYFNPKWQESVKNLTDEELQERMNNKEWQESYRKLCQQELESRK